MPTTPGSTSSSPTLPLSGLAARQAAVELGGITAGQSVLVNGAGGAVGSLVVQLAADAGARVTAVDQLEHTHRLHEYSADRVVGPLGLDAGPDVVGGPVDVVVNHVRLGPEGLSKLTAYVSDGGSVVSSAGPVPDDKDRSVRTAGVWVAPNGSYLADLATRIDEGRLQLHVVARRALSDLPAIHHDASNGTLRGKAVIVVA